MKRIIVMVVVVMTVLMFTASPSLARHYRHHEYFAPAYSYTNNCIIEMRAVVILARSHHHRGYVRIKYQPQLVCFSNVPTFQPSYQTPPPAYYQHHQYSYKSYGYHHHGYGGDYWHHEEGHHHGHHGGGHHHF